MKAICNIDVPVESQAPKTSSQTKKKDPQGKKPGDRSGLKRKQSSKHTSESKTEASKSKSGQSDKETQSSLAKDKNLTHPSSFTPRVAEMHKEAQQAAGGTHPSVLVDKTKFARDGLKTAHPDLGTNEDSRSDENLKKIKIEDLSNLMQDTRSAFFSTNSLVDEPIIVSDSKEEENESHEDTHATSHNEPEDTSVPPPPSPKSVQLQELMAQVHLLQSQKDTLEQQKAKELPTEFLGLPSKISSVQEKLKTLDALPSLLHKVTNTLNRFATVIENALAKATDKSVPSACQVDASPTKGEKNTNPATKDAETTNLNNELVYLIGIDVVEKYHNKKLLYDKYYDKMLKRRKSSKIINCDVLTQKGPITLKVVQACPDMKEKGWNTIYGLIKTRMEYLNQTKKELKIDFNKPLKEQDPLNELNDFANKKRKRTGDLKDHSRYMSGQLNVDNGGDGKETDCYLFLIDCGRHVYRVMTLAPIWRALNLTFNVVEGDDFQENQDAENVKEDDEANDGDTGDAAPDDEESI
ncbi:hypothetical protein Tco_0721634 [Tanacetum coccineum]